MSAQREPGLIAGMSDTDYHADPALSSSQARRLLEVAPAQWLWEQENPRPISAALQGIYELGKAVHTWTLGEGATPVEVTADAWTTKAAKDARALARAAGDIPLLTADYRAAAECARNLRAHPAIAKALRHGEPELSGWCQDPVTGVWLRFRPDCMYTAPDGRVVVIDVKTSESADPRHFADSVRKYGYAAQEAFYRDCLAELDIDCAFVFAVVSKTAPYLTSVIELDAAAVEYGRRRNRRAIDIYAECLESGVWPGYDTGIHHIDLPTWVYRQEEKEEL